MPHIDIGPPPRRRSGPASASEAAGTPNNGDGSSHEGRDLLTEKADPIGDHFHIHTIDEIIASSGVPPPWIIEDMLPVKGLATLSGRAKSQKSWIALDLSLSMPGKREWLGFQTKPGSTVYVNLELSHETLTYRIKKIAEAKEINLAELKRRFLPVTIDRSSLFCASRELDLDEMFCGLVTDQVQRAVERAKLDDPALVVLDSFYNLSGSINENDSGDVTRVYSHIRKLGTDLGCAGLLIHHFPKGAPGERMEGDRAAGSRVHRQEPNAYIELAPHREDGAVIFSADLRDYAPVKKFCLVWEHPLMARDDDLDPDDLKRLPSRGSGTTYSAKEILGVLREKPLKTGDWLAEAHIATGVGRSQFYAIKKRLEKTGRVVEKANLWHVA